jgi:tetratricopeptide (TPR) repeat protein
MPGKYLLILLLIIKITGKAQQPPAIIDSFKIKLARATTGKEKVEMLGKISQLYMSVNPLMADSFGKKMMEEAEISRDRSLIIKALLTNGERNSYLARRKENLDKAIDYYNRALTVAKENKMDKEIAESYLLLSSIYRVVPDGDKAFSYCNQAFSYISTIENDSMKVLGHLEYGEVYSLKREKLLALRNYLSGLRIAEEIKNKELLRESYSSLVSFYADIEDFDKAIDYAVKAMNMLSEIKKGQSSQYQKVVDLNTIGSLYSLKKDYDMATYYFGQSIRLADSLKYEPLKMPAYQGILNNYLNAGKPRQALDYLNNASAIKESAVRFGMGPVIDYAYGYIYTDLAKYDSAKYFYNKAAPFFENNSNEASSYVYYYQVGRMYKEEGDNKKAIEYFLRANQIANKVADPKRILDVAKELDSVYLTSGNYQESHLYNSMYYQYKDSLDKLGKEKDLLQIEAADEQQRQIRLQKEKEKALERSHNIQYMAITIGIALFFVLLVVMGIFKVSETTIKVLGFFAFIMFFEFIILIADNKIHHLTHGEPWKVLAIKIILIAMLLPLHHWLEKKAIKYLTSHNRLTAAGHHIRKAFSRNKSSGL